MADSAPRLEPFVLLARSTQAAATAKVIMDATAAAGVYVFAELLDLLQIQQLQSDPKYSKQSLLLQLFAYGTLKDYNASPDSYPSLAPTHLIKLKHLTLVSLALQHRSLSYDALQNALQVNTVRELEDLIIDVIYAGLLGGKMHHHERILHIDWAAGRDSLPEDLTSVQAGLRNWCSTAESLLSALDEEILHLRSISSRDFQQLAQYHEHRDEQYAQFASSTKSNNDRDRGKRGGGRDMRMGTTEPSSDDVLAGVMGGRMLGARNAGQSDELVGLRSSKRFKD